MYAHHEVHLPSFSFTINVSDTGASWSMSTNDQGVTVGMAALPLTHALRWVLENAGRTCLTNEEAEIRAALDAKRRALPDGWEATLDGVSTTSTDGVVCYSRWYSYKGGEPVEAPCAVDGSNVPATRDVLTAATPPEA